MEIEIRNFTVRRGEFVLQPVSLTIREGEIFALLGRTGSGKTVLLEAIAGMFPGDKGEVLYDGVNVMEIPPCKRKMGIVYQNDGLFPHMKVEDNISYGLRMHGYSKQERKQTAEELMDMLSISHIRNQYPGTLSGGEKQRTALARALALRPELLLLDEPFSALDPATKEVLYKNIMEIHRLFGCTIIFVTHDFKEAELLSSEVGILLEGELLEVTEGKQLLKGSYSRKIEEFLGGRK